MPVMLRILGCGDAFGHGGRLQSCYLVEDDAGSLALDFGATSMVALARAGIDPDQVGAVLVSHLHGDHFGGLPFLILWKQIYGSAEASLTLAGPPGFAARLRALFEAMYPGSWRAAWRFALEIVEIEPSVPATLGGRRVLSLPVLHRAGPEPATALRLETGGRVIAYSGDSAWTEALVEIARGADIFLCECNELQDRGHPGHMSHARLAREIGRLEAARVLLVHAGPEMLAHAGRFVAELARDGMVVALDGRDRG